GCGRVVARAVAAGRARPALLRGACPRMRRPSVILGAGMVDALTRKTSQADETVTRVTMLSVPVCAEWWSPRRTRPRVVPCSRRPRQQRSQADQVVRRGGEGHDPIDQCTAAVSQLAQPADRLHPAEDLLNQLSFPL